MGKQVLAVVAIMFMAGLVAQADTPYALIDDADVGFRTSSDWTLSAVSLDPDFNNDSSFIWYDTDHDARAGWNFTGVAKGAYDVYAMWPTGPWAGTHGTFTLSDDGGSAEVNFNAAAIHDVQITDAQGKDQWFEKIGTVTVEDGTVSVALSFSSAQTVNGAIIADAVALLPVSTDGGGGPIRMLENRVLKKEIPSAVPLYPILDHARADAAPRVRLRLPTDEQFGADIRLTRDAGGLWVDVEVKDLTAGPIAGVPELWRRDSVQVGIETDLDHPSAEGYDGSGFEMDFSVEPATGEVLRHARSAAGFNLTLVKTESRQVKDGYGLRIYFPWTSLNLSAETLPEGLRINVLINDWKAGKGRRAVQWTDGITPKKLPALFAQALFVPFGATKWSAVKTDGKEGGGLVGRANFLSWSSADRPAGKGTLELRGPTPAAQSFDLSPAPPGSLQHLYFGVKLGRKAKGHEHRWIVGTESESAEETFALPDPVGDVERALAKYSPRRERIDQALGAHPAWAEDSYISLGITLLDHFMQKAHAEMNSQPTVWTELAARQMSQVAEHVLDRLGDLQQGAAVEEIDTRSGDNACTVGFGHFQEIPRDMPLLKKLGVALVQQERGASTLTEANTLTGHGRSIGGVLDIAQAQGIAVDVLATPHYFPGWAKKKHPELMDIRVAGFLRHNLDHPVARDVMSRWMELFLPLANKSPALHSFCLSNEPTYWQSGYDPYSRPAWTDYLRRTHGDIETLNKLYATQYKSFEQVDPPAKRSGGDVNAQRVQYDWILFNRQHFAAWHGWLQEHVDRLAPGVPTHAKLQSKHLTREGLSMTPCFERLCDITDYAGCDYIVFPDELGGFVYNWSFGELWYDLLHSLRGQEIFNSEFHIFPDGWGPEEMPDDYVRAVMWQGALHHLSKSVMWLWADQRNAALNGNFSLRPACLYEIGQSMLDIKRLTPQIRALRSVKPKVALLYSETSVIWDKSHAKAILAAYRALTLSGYPVTFITELQLATGHRNSAHENVDILILPSVTHLSAEARQGLDQFCKNEGNLLVLGAGNLEFDEYQRTLSTPGVLQKAPRTNELSDEQALAAWLRFALGRLGAPAMLVKEVATGQPAWGVECRVAGHAGATLVNIINFFPKPQTVRLELSGEAIDLLSGETIDLQNITLQPRTPHLLRISTP